MKRRYNGGRNGRQNKQRGLVTERDIDPRFGLFTEDEAGGTVMSAADELLRQQPENGNDGQS